MSSIFFFNFNFSFLIVLALGGSMIIPDEKKFHFNEIIYV